MCLMVCVIAASCNITHGQLPTTRDTYFWLYHGTNKFVPNAIKWNSLSTILNNNIRDSEYDHGRAWHNICIIIVYFSIHIVNTVHYVINSLCHIFLLQSYANLPTPRVQQGSWSWIIPVTQLAITIYHGLTEKWERFEIGFWHIEI